MITIEFLSDYNGFKEGSKYSFDDSKAIILVGDNGSGKSTILNTIWIGSIRQRLKEANETPDFFNLTPQERNSLGTKLYNFFNAFDNIVKINLTNTNYSKFDMDTFDLSKIDNTHSLRSSEIVTSMQLKNLSQGESKLNQFFDFVESESKKDRKFIFDEPDSNISIKHAVVLGKYLNEKSDKIIMSLHHPLTIEQYEHVYYLEEEIVNNKRIGTNIIEMNGKDYVNMMISKGNEIIEKNGLGGK